MRSSRIWWIVLLVVFTVAAWYYGVPKSGPAAAPPVSRSEEPAARAGTEAGELSPGRVEERKTEQAQAVWERFALRNLARPMSPAALEQFVTAQGRSVGSLLAAWSEGHDRGWLEEAARRFPENPAVQLAVLTNNLFPEQRAEWIRRFKESSPDNPLASYLAANEQFKGGFRTAAIAELREAMTRTVYNDYMLESLEERETMERSAFSDPAEAEARALTLLPAGQVTYLHETAKSLLAVQKEAVTSGDWPAAEDAAALGVDMAHAIVDRSGPASVLTAVVALSVEKAAIQGLAGDPNAAVALGFDPGTRVAEIERDQAEIKALTASLNPDDVSGFGRYAVEFSQRVKREGELAAYRWLAAQR